MNYLYHDSADFEAELERLSTRTAFTREIDQSVADILDDIRKNGDSAIIRYAKQFDQVELSASNFRISSQVLEDAESKLSEPQKQAIRNAHEHVRDFSGQRVPQSWTYNPRPGVTLGERYTPIPRITAYIPGGASPLASTVIHTVTMAATAGVREIVVTTPCDSAGNVHPAILYAAKICGATEVYRLGGVYGIGAFAFGTKSINKADKIVGPGNAYVTAAKRMVYGHVALDLVAGPSEVMVIADETAPPSFIAADLLAQAEHGSGHEKAVLLSTAKELLTSVSDAISEQATKLGRSDIIGQVLTNGTFLVHVRDINQAVAIANDFAPEHLEIITKSPEGIADRINSAGAVFLGPWTPESIGDFVAGPSHVLPTGGAGRFSSGLTVDQFMRRSSIMKYDKEALGREAAAVEAFARMEELDAHGNSVRMRLT